MHDIIICIGSNIPECRQEISMAIKWLIGNLINPRHTSPYPTSPEGIGAGNTPYLNAVIDGGTYLAKEELEASFKAYEHTRGRKPSDKAQGKIIIDIDLVCYDDEVRVKTVEHPDKRPLCPFIITGVTSPDFPVPIERESDFIQLFPIARNIFVCRDSRMLSGLYGILLCG